MNKKDFSIGLVAGFVLSMCLSFFLINYYIEQKVEEAKVSAEKKYETLKNKLETEFKEEVASLKAYTSQKAAEKGTELMENASDKLKKYWNKEGEEPDSLSTE
jgi:hypothetical protein